MPSTSPPPSQGYVLDSSYPDTFFQELSPAWLSYVGAMGGVRAKSLDSAFTYLELGAGLAHSTVVNAGAFPRGEFHACDFNPEHVEAGRALRECAGLSNFEFHEASFEQLLEKDLPPFDFIVLHGVYSWVGADSRAAIRRIIQESSPATGSSTSATTACRVGRASYQCVACSSSSHRRRTVTHRRRCAAPLSSSRR